ncbi:MAG: endolytic transglycosylase MltG, partial [Treponemataceae bacterium]|nr:endolytic transglycosylase MltG [Treponemataceae bacterium]
SKNKVIKSDLAFYAYTKIRRPVIKAGFYKVSSDMSVKEIVNILIEGKQALAIVSIPEGLTMRRIGEIMENNHICPQSDFLAACNDGNLLAEFNLETVNFEGFLFPDTYYLSPGMDAEEVVRVMVENFYDQVNEIPGFSNLSKEKQYYVLKLASVVEREYRVEDEAPLIASVFSNRLRRSIGLYSCATVEYIITEIEGRPHPDVITYKDLKIDSPYNTYLYAGLPPTPISNPGMVALKAAANPPRTSYYYFRLVDSKAGRHHFSSDFDEHTETGRNISTKKAAGY